MPTFVTGKKLKEALHHIIENAEKRLIIVSPYIKISEELLHLLKVKRMDTQLEIVILFGKNEANLYQSFSETDINFFKDFPNIEIRYEKKLHAKYYANENASLICSMNLYDFSIENNIEAGVYFETGLLNNLFADSFDSQAYEFFQNLIQSSEIWYKSTPSFHTNLIGQKGRYKGSNVSIDKFKKYKSPALFESKKSKK